MLTEIEVTPTKIPSLNISPLELETQMTPKNDHVGKKRKCDKLDSTSAKDDPANESFVSSTSERIKRIMLERPRTPSLDRNNLSCDSEVSSSVNLSSNRANMYRLECVDLGDPDGFCPIPRPTNDEDYFIGPMDEVPFSQEIPI